VGQDRKNLAVKNLWLYLAFLVLVVIVGAVWLLHRPGIWSEDVGNVILISIDTCRADYLGCYGFGRGTTPNIDAVARQSVLFENVVVPAPLTLPSHCSMLTGTIPPYHGAHDNLNYRLGDSSVTIAEILKEQGFVTGAVISTFVLDSQFGLKQGFDSYNDTFEGGYTVGTVHERRGGETNRFAIEWLEQHKGDKFFFFLHYFDPHTEYTPPEPFASRFADDLYAGEIAYTDYCIGQVVQKLRDLGLFDSSLLIIAGDHGEMLGEHGEEDHGYFIYQSAIKVPLLFKLPGQSKGEVVKDLVGLVDIVPTICGLVDIEPMAQMHGKDLSGYLGGKSAPGEGRYVYTESLYPTKYNANTLLGVVTDRWKYIQTTRPELYDLIGDPRESNNVIEQHFQQARILQDRLKQILEQTVRERQTDGKVELDERSRKRLESLGYVSGAVNEDFEFDQSKEDPKDLVDFHVLNTNANRLMRQNRNAEAKKLCRELLAQRPDCFFIYRMLGKMAFGENDKENARGYMLESLRLNPDQWDLHNKLSVLLARDRKYDEAIEHLRKSLEINPVQIVARNNLAALLDWQGSSEEAASCYVESLRVKDNQPDIHVKLGDILYRQKKVNEAVKHWGESLKFNPKEPYAIHNRLGSAFYRLGKVDEAVKNLGRSLELKPEQPDIRNNIAVLLAQQKAGDKR